MIIDRLPSFVQCFFSPMPANVSKPQFSHLWSLVLAVIVNLRASKLIHLSATTPDHGHRTRRGAFLSQSQWDSAALVDQAAIAFRGVVLPWRMELWKPKGHSGPRFRKLTNIAAEMIRAFEAPAGVEVRVLFDAFYLCQTVVTTGRTCG